MKQATARAESTPTEVPARTPGVTAGMVRDYAEQQGVCVRPLLRKVTDRQSGAVHQLVIPCGSTRDAVCPPCAGKAVRLRRQQCAEGWHLTDDPLDGDQPDDQDGEHPDELDDLDERDEQGESERWDRDDDAGDDAERSGRRVRSTRRRADAAELPRVSSEQRSIGRAFTARDGTVYRPSMFVTLTLGSYGRIRPGTGTPVDPRSYDYRRAAVEALHFTKLFDRWVQNLRRCAGYRVQYFGAVEAQRRMAPHLHLALRGAIPRAVLRQVTRATYLQLWWPRHDPEDLVYPEHRLPLWDADQQTYRDPDTGMPLPTWEEALDQLDHDVDQDADQDAGQAGQSGRAGPAVVLRFGAQLDIKGIIAPSAEADRAIRYLTKYLTKDVATTYTRDNASANDDDGERHDGDGGSGGERDRDDGRGGLAYRQHLDRLWQQLRVLPCSPDCGNWLRYGIQPRHPEPRPDQATAGSGGLLCPGKAHTRDHLGLGGRRVQVSRHWSGKTLTEHRADRAAVVREVLAAAGVDPPAADRLATSVLAEDGKPRFVWEDLPAHASRDYIRVVMGSVIEAHRWRAEYDNAKTLHAERARRAACVQPRAGPGPTGDGNSATTPLRPPDPQPTQVG
jgi:hypothetical protein